MCDYGLPGNLQKLMSTFMVEKKKTNEMRCTIFKRICVNVKVDLK